MILPELKPLILTMITKSTYGNMLYIVYAEQNKIMGHGDIKNLKAHRV